MPKNPPKKEFKKGIWVRDSMNGYIGQVIEVEKDHCKFRRYQNNKPKIHRVLKRNLVIVRSDNA